MTISVVILTCNSEAVIADTISRAKLVSDDIHVVDSFSRDGTVDLVRAMGARCHQRAFADYADQRNWAISDLDLRYGWQLHLDADEILTQALVDEINALKAAWPPGVDGFFIRRLTRFMGRDLLHGGYYPTYHMRLFRTGCVRVEDRKYDQHFVLSGTGRTLTAPFVDDHRASLSEWIARHNRWSDLEVEDLEAQEASTAIRPDAAGNPIERARFRKAMYYRAPLLLRPFALFLYKYFVRLGFLDGIPGLVYCVLQCFWYRFLVDAKLHERRVPHAPFFEPRHLVRAGTASAAAASGMGEIQPGMVRDGGHG
ncbi:glycosyltransferase family 2 protein [Arenibaculum pallidiluteum]|uniref:glycosyltransferase family 2 protein n=1 Tax=Arenibaculum pallidiluteum TaxID=2812559 RepID=UPI001A974CFE|nr:glycosyltransferase family 2 protein [Arenibaculum pallidiluteum]